MSNHIPDSIILRLCALRTDRPNEYMYVRYAYELRVYIEEGRTTLGELGVTNQEYDTFMRYALIAQALVIARDVEAGEPLVHPVLVDPRKVIRLLGVLYDDAPWIRQVKPDIYRLSRGFIKMRENGEKLSGAELRGLLPESFCTGSGLECRVLRTIIALMGDHPDVSVGEFITRLKTDNPDITRTAALSQLLRTKKALNAVSDLPFNMAVVGAKISGDQRMIAFIACVP